MKTPSLAIAPLCLLLCLLLGWLLGLCACRQQPPPEVTVLRFWHTFNDQETATVEALLRDFEAQHPSTRVEVTVLPFGSARHRLRAALRDGTGPDLARAEVAWLPELAHEQLLEDLSAEVNLDEHLPQARPLLQHQGRTWAWPQSVDCLVLYYDRHALRDLDEAPPKTLDDLLRVARRLTRDDQGRDTFHPEHDPARVQRHGLYLKGDGYVFLPFLWGYGGATLDVARGEVLIDAPRSVEAAAAFQALATRHGVVPPHLDFSNDYQEEIARFGQGRVAMIINGPWAARDLLAGPVFAQDAARLGVAPVPRGPGGEGGSPVGGHGYVLRRGSSPKARALAAFLASPAGQRALARENHILPTREALYQAPEIRDDALLSAFRAALEESHPRAIFPGMARLFDALTPAVQALLRGQGEPAALMGAVAREWRQILPPATGPGASPAAPGSAGSSPPPARP